MASGALHGLSFIAEATRGSTPATPTMTPIRHTSCSLLQTIDFSQSAELRSDRQITDTVDGPYKVAGDIGFELSYGSFDSILEAVLQGTWNTNVLKAGVTRRYHTIEEYYADLDVGSKPYHRFRGCEFDKMSMSIKAGNEPKLNGTFSVVGKDLALDTVIITGETYSAASTTTPFSSFVGVLEEGGAGTTIVTELSIALDNGIAGNMDKAYVVGSRASTTPDTGRSNITGNLTTQFKTVALLEKFLACTESSLEITLTDLAGNDLTILLPRIKYTGLSKDVSNEGSILASFTYQALYHDTDASNIVITRAPA